MSPLADRRNHLAALAVLLLLTVAIAAPHIAGKATLIGDSDRLNTFLNIKLGETISIQETGRVPAWSENSFMGFNLRGLYWMLPGFNPDAYVHALRPIGELVRNAGLVTFGLLFLAMVAAYAFLADAVGRALPAAVGACTYGCAALSLGRVAQVDSAYFTIILLPLGVLAIRRARADSWRAWLATLSAVVAVMLGLAFLQEAAYALLFFGAYALFRAARERSALPIVVLFAACLVGTLVASPRIVTVAEEFELMFRTTQPSFTGATELLRVFHDGIFGRYWREAWEVIGNVGFNIHEGVQTYSSTVAACLVAFSFLIVDLRRLWLPVFFLIAVFVMAVYSMRPLLGMVVGIAALALCVVEYLKRDRRYNVPVRDATEFGFHLAAVALVLAFVLLPAFRSTLHHLFFKVDFLHSRVVLAALLPLAAVVAFLLAGLMESESGPAVHPVQSELLRIAAVAVGAAVLIAVLHFGLFSWDAGLEASQRKLSWRHLNLSRVIVIRSLVIVALVLAAMLVLRRSNGGTALQRAMLAAALCVVIVLECFLYARERLLGEHTYTYPVAFRTGNYFTAPPGVLNPPTGDCRQQLAQRLQNDRYRSIVVADEIRFPAFAAPHLSQYWQLRLLDGYPGLPLRIAELPWPFAVGNLRSIAFRGAEDLPWLLLSILNVKNAVVLNEALYYNVPASARDVMPCPALGGLTVLENPYPVLPRQFFVAHVRPAASSGSVQPVEGLVARALAPDRAELTWWPQIRDGEVEIQMRRESEREFATVARFSPLNYSRHLLPDLVPGTRYAFRARKPRSKHHPEFIGEPVEVRLPLATVISPRLMRIQRNSAEAVDVEWEAPFEFVSMRVEVREGIGGTFRVAAEAPRGSNSARLALGPGAEKYAVRLQAVLAGDVSPHSEERWLGSATARTEALVRKAFRFDVSTTASVEGVEAPRSYSAQGFIRAEYAGDRVRFEFDSALEPRFLVVNELYHPRWRAYVDSREQPIYAVNRVMRGVEIPAGAKILELRFEPFLSSPAGVTLASLGLLALAALLASGGRLGLLKGR